MKTLPYIVHSGYLSKLKGVSWVLFWSQTLPIPCGCQARITLGTTPVQPHKLWGFSMKSVHSIGPHYLDLDSLSLHVQR